MLKKRGLFLVLFLVYIYAFAQAREYTPEEKLAQMFMLGFKGASLPEFAAFVSGNHWGGYIFYAEDTNIADSGQAAGFLQSIAGRSSDTKIKPFLAVDMEGGGWQLAKEKTDKGLVYFVSPRNIAGTDPESRKSWAENIAAYTKTLGFNLNLSPVVDVDRSPFNNSRSFGGTAETVIENARLFLDAHQANGVVCALKHFPGRGSGRQEDIDNLYERASDLRPFQALAAHQNTGLIMISTLVYPNIDPDKPAHKSPEAYKLLRALGYRNIALTDDISGCGATIEELQNEIVEIIEAGADMLLLANKGGNYDPQLSVKLRQAVKNIVRRRLITEERIEESFARILAVKQKHNIEPEEIYLNYEI
ncbi:periplasmic beta-glucosidase GHF 3 [Candidatus Termititenax aidoneus]|uniref:beta-N-acetylhexosaminidase n=1 Tax=Termititenax aidoneus TaxID=2218524 RepID=A0A388T826_TERA1|nr:periplasmic beta-glucosidase GHF 3 [Candidatus Termititenax aidoneus]